MANNNLQFSQSWQDITSGVAGAPLSGSYDIAVTDADKWSGLVPYNSGNPSTYNWNIPFATAAAANSLQYFFAYIPALTGTNNAMTVKFYSAINAGGSLLYTLNLVGGVPFPWDTGGGQSTPYYTIPFSAAILSFTTTITAGTSAVQLDMRRGNL